MDERESMNGEDSESSRNKKFRATTVAYLTLASLGVLGTAITYGRSVVTRDDMQQDLAPLYQRLDAEDSQIDDLKARLANIEGRLSIVEGAAPDPPGHPARKTWAAKKKGASK